MNQGSAESLMKDRVLLLGTSNRKKVIELEAHLVPRGFALKTPADFSDVIEVEETGATFMENARLKAIAQAQARGMWAIGEDSGLCVPVLGGEPGVLSARYSGSGATDQSNNAKLLASMAAIDDSDRAAYYVSTVVLSDPDGKIALEASGECWGRILKEPRGTAGFGYDPLFEVPEYHRTFAELGLQVKRAISHRSRALRAFLRNLDLLQHSIDHLVDP
jgi:XTP/dITP diphosphohydrolase